MWLCIYFFVFYQPCEENSRPRASLEPGCSSVVSAAHIRATVHMTVHTCLLKRRMTTRCLILNVMCVFIVSLHWPNYTRNNPPLLPLCLPLNPLTPSPPSPSSGSPKQPNLAAPPPQRSLPPQCPSHTAPAHSGPPPPPRYLLLPFAC